jgi:hypothetical protein
MKTVMTEAAADTRDDHPHTICFASSIFATQLGLAMTNIKKHPPLKSKLIDPSKSVIKIGLTTSI